MRLPLSAQAEAPWLVRDIATDFTLDEVWEFPIVADADKGETFRTFCEDQDLASAEPLPGLAGKLMQLRLLLGKIGLDQRINELPIPGCSETSVGARLTAGTRRGGGPVNERLPFRIVYDLENERLLELSNGTVHALLHFSWAHKQGALHAPRMAVYVKPRGWFGRLYMGLIYPFRVLFVYPAIMRSAKRRWERHHVN